MKDDLKEIATAKTVADLSPKAQKMFLMIICAILGLFFLIICVSCSGGNLTEEEQEEKHQEFLIEAKTYVETIDKNVELVGETLDLFSENPLYIQETYDIVKKCKNNIGIMYQNTYHKYYEEEYDLVNDYRTKVDIWLDSILKYLETKSLESNNTAQRRAEKVKEVRNQITFIE